VALDVGIVGLPGSGKTTLFNALTSAHAAVGAYAEKPNVGMATIVDDRLAAVARIEGSAKETAAAIRISDVPGTGAAMLGNLRRADALLVVVGAFSAGARPEADLEALRLELLVADRDHVEKRLDTVRRQAKSGEQSLRDEAAELERLLTHLEAGELLASYDRALPPDLEPLTTKPLVVVENGPGAIDAKLEEELAELPVDEAAEFREGASALEEVVHRLRDALDLITFFTAGEKEARAWTLRHGATALDAAASIHTDMALGFVRCEVIRWSDLVECGSRAEASRRGLQRLEGKAYVVEDGDVLNIRFTPPR
jgi:ribosome-binding ATPase YchF (GTP1/OBG family)